MAVGLRGESSSGVYAAAKFERVAMSMDGDCVVSDPGLVSASGITTVSDEEG